MLKADKFITLSEVAELLARNLQINIPLEVSRDAIFEINKLGGSTRASWRS